ncbi:hypothetical protein AAVH_22758 [Aphelenchoides avenae]|nr:hypothetical protein AAVH_22758 [Aphelenchus avenae]
MIQASQQVVAPMRILPCVFRWLRFVVNVDNHDKQSFNCYVTVDDDGDHNESGSNDAVDHDDHRKGSCTYIK